MSITNVFEYKHAKKKKEELQTFLTQLDHFCDILYNNINKKGVWELIEKIEEVRVENYVLWHEYDQISKKG